MGRRMKDVEKMLNISNHQRGIEKARENRERKAEREAEEEEGI